MRNINLLPKWYIKRNRNNRLIKTAAFIQAAAFLFVILIVHLADMTIRDLENELVSSEILLNESKYITADSIINEIRETEAATEILKVVSSEISNFNVPTQYIKNLIELVPENISIKSLEIIKQGGKIQFTGIENENGSISKFIAALENSEDFSGAVISEALSGDNNVLSFRLEITMNGLDGMNGVGGYE